MSLTTREGMPEWSRRRRLRALLASAATLLLLVPAAVWAAPAAEDPDKLRGLVADDAAIQKDAAATQERIDGLDDETQKLLAEYRRIKNETESLRTYNEQIAAQIPSQVEEMQQLERQLEGVEATSRDVLPLMQRMLDTLKQFVELDRPFLPEERKKRVTALLEMMDRANVSISEKFRRVVEAYQIEMEYGRTLEAYEGKLGEGDQARTVQFLRVGRIALMYQTLDQKETGYWDSEKKDWVIDNEYKSAFAKNVAVAKKLGAPDLLVVPVPAPREVES